MHQKRNPRKNTYIENVVSTSKLQNVRKINKWVTAMLNMESQLYQNYRSLLVSMFTLMTYERV